MRAVTDAPRAVWTGCFSLFGVEVRCHELDDGRRIIDADSLANVIEGMARGEALVMAEMEKFTTWRHGRAQECRAT